MENISHSVNLYLLRSRNLDLPSLGKSHPQHEDKLEGVVKGYILSVERSTGCVG